jgi:lambda repressor-like predicted transcriptional regulator
MEPSPLTLVLKRRINRSGRSVRELAKTAGVPQATLHRHLARGQAENLTVSAMDAVAKELGTSIEKLVADAERWAARRVASRRVA